MYYVYLLRSESHAAQTYIGCTENLKQRLATHNAGGSSHTSKYCPWKLVSYHAFKEKPGALAFERYLKSHSGQAFARKRLW